MCNIRVICLSGLHGQAHKHSKESPILADILHNQTISTQCADEILLELDEFYAEIEIIVKNLRK